MTIRRDLRALAADGRLLRFRGGAIAEGVNRPFAEVEVEHFAEKDRIGAAAAELVLDRETILLDVGTTQLQLARHLKDRPLTVITSNLAVYEELLPNASVELILLGGRVDRAYRALAGFLVEEALTQLSADRAFMSAVGLRSDLSVMDDAMGEMRVKRAMIAAAGSVVLMLDSSKFGVEGGARVCGADEIDVLITDQGAPQDLIEKLRDRGVRIICV